MRVNFIFHLYTNMYFIFAQLLFLGSLVLSLAHGRAGARATFPSFYYKSPASPAEWASKQASKKEGGLGEGIFARLLSAPKARSGWEAARPVSKEAKPAKIPFSFNGRAQKSFSIKETIFAGFAGRRQAASRWVGLPPCGRQSKVSIRIFL